MARNRTRGGIRPGRQVAVVAVAVLVALAVGPVSQASSVESAGPIDVQVLSIADYHGNLVPTNTTITDSAGNQYLVGGGAYLAAHFDRLSEGKMNSVRATSGDSISSSPNYDLWHYSEPTIEFFNHIGVDFNNIGNHELDIAAEHLVDHLWRGQCLIGEPGVDSCFVNSQGEEFTGSDFPHLAANLVYRDSLEPVAPPYFIKSFRTVTGPPVRVAFLNLTFQRNGQFETQSDQPALLGLDAVETANRYADLLHRRGIKAIVLNIHEGGNHSGAFDNCVNPTGPVINYASVMSPHIDAIIGAHTHNAFNCMLPDPDGDLRPIVQPGIYGRLINELNLKIDRVTGEVIREETTSINHPVTRDITPDPVVVSMASYWQQRQSQTAIRPMAEIAADLTRTADATGQSTIGNAAADAMYEDSQANIANPALRAELAMVPRQVFSGSNPFIGDLLYAPGTNPADAPGRVLFQEWRSAFGYRNPVITGTVTGAEIHAALEGQWRVSGSNVLFRPFAVSDNVRYSFDPDAPVGNMVDPADVLINSEPLDLGRDYRLAGLTYNLWGRDGHTALTNYRDPVRTSIDHDAFLDYLRRHAPAAPPELNRITIKSN